MNVCFLNWMNMKISTWSGSCDGQKPLKIFKSSTNSPIKTRCSIGLKKQQKILRLHQIPIQLVVFQNAIFHSSTKPQPARKYPERFSDDIFRDSLPELEFRLEEVRISTSKSLFWGVLEGLNNVMEIAETQETSGFKL